MKDRHAGFTLLEVMISMSLFLGISASMTTAYVSHLKQNTSTEVRSGAIAVAQQRLDELRLIDPPTMPSSGNVTTTLAAGGRTYSLKTYYCENTAFCATANSRHILVKVNYAGKQVFETETVYTRLR
jgi:general secretion pathway protein I